MKKLLSSLVVLLVFVLFVSSVTPIASASSGASLTPEAVLENYLTAVKNQDIEKVREYSVDERNMSIEEQKEIFEYEKLLDYKILKSEVKNENLNEYLLETTYEGDLVTQAPIQVKKINSEWKVFISSETLTSDENKVVDQGNTEYFQKAFSLKDVDPQKDIIKPMDVLLVEFLG